MAGPAWLDGANLRVVSAAGGDLVGGPPRWVWHTFEADPHRLTAEAGARALHTAGHDVHFVFNPLSGDIAQMLPAYRSARALKNLPGGVQTNRLGSVCLQVEVIGFAADPFTSHLTPAGRAGLGKLVKFARAHGIPDVWPMGPPPAHPGGYAVRDPRIWTSRAGHYGHSQVPENDHSDPGAIDVRVLWAAADRPAAPPGAMRGAGMDLVKSPDGRVWDVSAVGRRYVTSPDVVAAFQATGRTVAPITAAGLATIPRLPDGGLPAMLEVLAAMLPHQVDGVVVDLPDVVRAPTADEIADRALARLQLAQRPDAPEGGAVDAEA